MPFFRFGEANGTIRHSPADLHKPMQGNLCAPLAFAVGKLKMEGSVGLAMKAAALLDDD